MFTPPRNSPRRFGFSLIELVVVVAIIGIIAVFAVPAAGTIIRGSQLTQASQILTDQISLARQYALTKNRSTEVRFYRFGDSETPGEDPTKPESGKFRAMQTFEIIESGVALPIGKIQRFPTTIMINSTNDTNFSTLVQDTPASGAPQIMEAKDENQAPDLPRGVNKNYQYVAFRFLPDGSTNLLPTSKWYATIHAITEKINGTNLPPNFFTIQIDPVSGTTKNFRPSAG